MTRFTDRVTRDLGQIADRATPSPTAWESIQHRIDEQADPSTMEVIMLSPDRNDSPKRGWMLAAAAGVIILIGGLVFATTRSDDDTVPADTPQATLPAEPAPDAQVDPDAEAVVVPVPEPTTDAEVVPEPEPEPTPEAVTVEVTSTWTDSDVTTATTPSASGITGATSIQGVTTFEGEFAGTAPWVSQSWTLPDGSELGTGEFLFTGDIEGLGSGTLTMVDEWQIVDGVRSATMTITSGTGDFEGAYGSGVSIADPSDPSGATGGSLLWTITVPPADSLVTVEAVGTGFDPDFAAEPTDVDWSVTYSANTQLTGDIDGVAPHTGTAWVLDNSTIGRGEFEFTGSIAGLGTGTMTYTDRWVFADDTTTYTSFITGGTGDFEGITGTGTFIDNGDIDSYEFTLTAPVGQ